LTLFTRLYKDARSTKRKKWTLPLREFLTKEQVFSTTTFRTCGKLKVVTLWLSELGMTPQQTKPVE